MPHLPGGLRLLHDEADMKALVEHVIHRAVWVRHNWIAGMPLLNGMDNLSAKWMAGPLL